METGGLDWERVLRAGDPFCGKAEVPAVVDGAVAAIEADETAAVEADGADAAVDTAAPDAETAADAFFGGGSDMVEAFSHTALAGGWAPNVGTALRQVRL